MCLSQDVSGTLKTVAKGSTAVFAGTATGMVLALVWRLLVIRSLSQADFGTFFLAISIINLLVAVSTLGLPDGVPRYIAYFRGKKDEKSVGATVKAGSRITAIFSVAIAVTVFAISPLLEDYMHMGGLAISMQIMLVSLPFFAMAVLLTAVFRGFGVVRVKVYFIEFSKRLFIFLGVVFLMVFGLTNLISVSLVFSLSGIAVFIAVWWYYLRNRPDIETVKDGDTIRRMEKKLLVFSLPLLGMGFMDAIFRAIGPTVLGVMSTPEEIASFGAAITLSALMGVAMTSLNFLYLPLMSDFFARNMKEEMKRVYAMISKWLFFFMALVLAGFILFSDIISALLFSTEYSNTGYVMAIQAIGFFSIYLFGPVRATLIVIGKSYFLIISSAVGLVVSFSLTVLLSGVYGAVGASIGMAAGLMVMYGLNAIELQKKEGMNPFTREYSVTFTGGLIFLALSTAASYYSSLGLKHHIVLFFILTSAYLAYVVVFKAVEREDIEMFRTIIKKIRR